MNGIARIAAITLAMAAPAAADPLPPSDATALMPEAALACAAARYTGEVLRIDAREGGRIQELRWLTPQRNVLDIRLTGPGCRFLEVRGVGQIEARILPGPGP